jgi:DNA-binding NarL/FixJ family response regulator
MRLGREPDMTVVGEASNGEEALALAQTKQPDVVLMDVVMPGVDGIEATASLRTVCATCAVIILTMYDNAAMRARAQAAGAVGFLGKSEGLKNLLGAIHQAAQL